MIFRSIAVLAASTVAAAIAVAQPKPAIDAYGALPSISAMEISPDGKRVAILMHQPDRTMQLAIFDVDKNEVTHRMNADAVKARGLQFGDSDHVILQASETTRTTGFRGKYEYSAAMSIDLDDGDVVQLLSSYDNLHPVQSGLGGIIGRLPSGQLLMPAWTGSPYGTATFDLLNADLDRGSARRHGRGEDDTIGWYVGRGGKLFLREQYNDRQNRYELEKRANGTWEKVLEIESDEIPISIVAVADDNTGFYYVSYRDDEDGFRGLSRMNLEGESEGIAFFREGADIENVLTDVNQHLVGIQYSGLKPSYEFLDEKLQSSYDSMNESFASSAIYVDSWSEDRRRVLYRIFDGYRVDYYVLHDVDTGEMKLVGHSRLDVPQEAVGPVYTIEYPARDGLSIPAVITVPPGMTLDTAKDLPLVAMPHGGPRAYDRYGFDWMAQFFANRGYMVLQPNFRGSTGFGQAFEDAGEGEWGGKMQDDVTDGVQILTEEGFADPERVCIVGASYGGYSALAGGAYTPDLYKCVVSIAGVSDLNAMLRTTKRGNQHHWVVTYWERLMADGDARNQKMKSISPAEAADQFKAPVLLIHGEDDTVVEYEQSQIMERALKRADKPVDLIKLNGGDHWLSDTETRLQTLDAMFSFVDRHIGAQAAQSTSVEPAP